MSNIWVSSDWHLFHSNILTFKDNKGNLIRPEFSNVKEMNECILDNHNELVKPNDILYCLGDVTFNYGEVFVNLISKFNGRKRLIVGNHDDIKKLVKLQIFQKISMWRMFTEYSCILTHVPLHPSSLIKGDIKLINYHGHIHQNDSPEGNYFNVSLEKTKYKPIMINNK